MNSSKTRTLLTLYISNLALIKHTTPAKWSESIGQDRSYVSGSIAKYMKSPTTNNRNRVHAIVRKLGSSIKDLKSVLSGNKSLLWHTCLKASKSRGCNEIYALYLMHPNISNRQIAQYLNVKYSAVQHYYYVHRINTPDLEKLAELFNVDAKNLVKKMGSARPLHKINATLLHLRTKHHLSEPALAKKMHTAQTTISGYETIRSFNGGYKPLFEYARLFKVSWYDLLHQTPRFKNLQKYSPAYYLLEIEANGNEPQLSHGSQLSILHLQNTSDCIRHLTVFFKLMNAWGKAFTFVKALAEKKRNAEAHLIMYWSKKGKDKKSFAYRFQLGYFCGLYNRNELAKAMAHRNSQGKVVPMSKQNIENYLDYSERLQANTQDQIRGAIAKIRKQHRRNLYHVLKLCNHKAFTLSKLNHRITEYNKAVSKSKHVNTITKTAWKNYGKYLEAMPLIVSMLVRDTINHNASKSLKNKLKNA